MTSPNSTVSPIEGTMNEGLTKREYFAALAMQGILASHTEVYPSPVLAAEKAVQFADSLIEALNKK